MVDGSRPLPDGFGFCCARDGAGLISVRVEAPSIRHRQVRGQRAGRSSTDAATMLASTDVSRVREILASIFEA